MISISLSENITKVHQQKWPGQEKDFFFFFFFLNKVAVDVEDKKAQSYLWPAHHKMKYKMFKGERLLGRYDPHLCSRVQIPNTFGHVLDEKSERSHDMVA